MLVARGVVTTGSPEHPAFPARQFYGLLRALPGDRAFLPPSPPRRLPRKLDASTGASGPHDFAVRFSAVRQKRLRVHRIPPHVRDDRETPLVWDGMARNKPVIWVGREADYFCTDSWTGQISLKRLGKFGCTRRCRSPSGSLLEPTDHAKARAMTGF